MKKGFILYFDNCRKLNHLPDAQYAAVMRAVTEYAERLAKGQSEEAYLAQRLSALPPEAAMALDFMADNARRDHQSYQETIDRRSQKKTGQHSRQSSGETASWKGGEECRRERDEAWNWV